MSVALSIPLLYNQTDCLFHIVNSLFNLCSLEKVLEGVEADKSLAAICFLRMLMAIREIILQDVPVLLESYPDLFLWQHPLFHSDEFKAYQIEQKLAMSESVDPKEDGLSSAMPELMEYLKNSHDSLSQNMNENFSAVKRSIHESIAERNERSTMISQVADFLEGNMSFKLTPQNPKQPNNPCAFKEAFKSTLSSDQESSPPIASSLIEQYDGNFEMNKTIKTVTDVWQEWHIGIGNQSSIIAMDRQYGASWRKSAAKKKFYQRRKILIQAIYRIMDTTKKSEADAVTELENKRLRLSNTSLDSLRGSLQI